MSGKEAWESFPEIWPDEKSFMSYLRGAFRSVWSKFPAKIEWKKQQMVLPPPGYVGRAKTVGTCAFCKQIFPASKLEVDHIEQAGGFRNKEGAIQWFWRLLDTNDNWQLTCKPCHKIKSHQEKNEGMTFEEARIDKEIIRLMKKESRKELLAILEQHGYNGCSNDKKRREALTKILKEDK